jgi:hypothetical protein
MPYRATYSLNIDWVGAGEGPMGGGLVGAGVTTTQGPSSGGSLPQGGRGGAQTLDLVNSSGGQNIVGSGTAGAMQASDVSGLVTLISNDLTTIITAAVPKLAGFATGGG